MYEKPYIRRTLIIYKTLINNPIGIKTGNAICYRLSATNAFKSSCADSAMITAKTGIAR